MSTQSSPFHLGPPYDPKGPMPKNEAEAEECRRIIAEAEAAIQSITADYHTAARLLQDNFFHERASHLRVIIARRSALRRWEDHLASLPA